METSDLAKLALKKYFSSLFRFQVHMEAENQSMQNNAEAMFDSLESNASSDSTTQKSQAQIESELSSQAETQVAETLNRTNIKSIKLGELGKADLIPAGSQTSYWPVSFEAVDPAHADNKLTLTIFAYRNAVGKWDLKIKTLQTQVDGISQEIPERMLKQLGL
jgi:preprotein translocase subunit SecD